MSLGYQTGCRDSSETGGHRTEEGGTQVMLLKPPTAQAWTVALPNPPPLRETATSRERLSRGQREGLTGVEQRSTEQTGVGR